MRALITIRVQWYVVDRKTLDCQFKINSDAPISSFINSVLMNLKQIKNFKSKKLKDYK